jgi:hypothetical protein
MSAMLNFFKDPYRHLDRLAIIARTDKSSKKHNYTKVYASFFDSLKDKRINFLEIGVQFGYSIKLWESYFRKANLHFIDIDFSYLIYQPKKAHLHRADQANQGQLIHVVEQIAGGIDILIDDGGHTMEQQQTSFRTLFPYVKPGGLYIIEDLHTSYWSAYRGNTLMTTVEFLKKEVDALNHPRESEIFSLSFYNSLCVIVKNSSSKSGSANK